MTFAMAGKEETKAYGTGWTGFANRYVRNVSDQIIGNMLTEGFMPIVLHQDPRYFRLGTGTFFSRLGSALVQIAIARNDADHRTFNSSEFLGNAIAVGISNTYSASGRHCRRTRLVEVRWRQLPRYYLRDLHPVILDSLHDDLPGKLSKDRELPRARARPQIRTCEQNGLTAKKYPHLHR